MIQTLLIKILLQFGSTFIINLLHAGSDKLKACKDNNLDIGADTIKMILSGIEITKAK